MNRKKSNKWSNSRINAFLTCAKLYKFKYIEKGNKEEFVSISIIVGSVFHSILELMYKDFYLKGILPLNQIKESFEFEWNKKLDLESKRNKEIVYYEDIDDPEVYKKYAWDCINRYYEKFYITGVETSFESCKTEEIVEPEITDLDGNIIKFRGFIDRYDLKDDVLTIIDYKTSRQAPNNIYLEKTFKQLYLYALGMKKQERFKDVKSINVKLIYPFPGKIINKLVTEDDLKDAENHYIDSINLIKNEKKFFQTPNYNCKSCGFRKICPEFSSIYKLKEFPDDLDIKDAANLADQLVVLKKRAKDIDKEIEEIKKKFIDNKRFFLKDDEEGRYVIPGAETDSEVVVNIEKVPKVPDSQDSMRQIMIDELKEKGFWDEIATLNAISVNPKLKKKAYSKELMDILDMYCYDEEESSRVTLRKAKKIDTKKKSLKLSLDNGPKTQVYSEETTTFKGHRKVKDYGE